MIRVFQGSGFFVNSNGVWTLKGMVSASVSNVYGDCLIKQFAIYTNVIKFKSWIIETVEKDAESLRRNQTA